MLQRVAQKRELPAFGLNQTSIKIRPVNISFVARQM